MSSSLLNFAWPWDKSPPLRSELDKIISECHAPAWISTAAEAWIYISAELDKYLDWEYHDYKG